MATDSTFIQVKQRLYVIYHVFSFSIMQWLAWLHRNFWHLNIDVKYFNYFDFLSANYIYRRQTNQQDRNRVPRNVGIRTSSPIKEMHLTDHGP